METSCLFGGKGFAGSPAAVKRYMNDRGVGEEKLLEGGICERKYVGASTIDTTTVGSYLARRLIDARCTTFFTVPGDFILGLLDSLLANKGLKMVGCCNELNAGYAGVCKNIASYYIKSCTI